jgi:hypothetical protein
VAFILAYRVNPARLTRCWCSKAGLTPLPVPRLGGSVRLVYLTASRGLDSSCRMTVPSSNHALMLVACLLAATMGAATAQGDWQKGRECSMHRMQANSASGRPVQVAVLAAARDDWRVPCTHCETLHWNCCQPHKAAQDAWQSNAGSTHLLMPACC